jgi:hypothetical protein
MPEIVGAFLSAEGGDERANSSVKPGDGVLSNFAQVGFEFAEGILDGVKVWRILRQIAKCRACGFDRLSYAEDFVGCKIVHHHDIVSMECWDEALFDIGKEHFSVHRPVNHHRRHHMVVTERGHEGDGLPVPMRHTINQPHATWSATVEPHHVRADCRLIEKYQPCRVKQALLSDPTPACPSHVRAMLFRRPQAFF